MTDGAPEKIRLIPDDWHIKHVGQLTDGRLFFVDGQLEPTRGETRDYVCTFIFDADGHLVEHDIELVGERGSYRFEEARGTFNKHLAALGDCEIIDIWIRPFAVESHGIVFGLIPVSPEEFMAEGDGPEVLAELNWCVQFMPGNTLSFYPPWEEGLYDT